MIQERLNWEPSISLREGLKKTYAWSSISLRPESSRVARGLLTQPWSSRHDDGNDLGERVVESLAKPAG